jgi:cytochrome c556
MIEWMTVEGSARITAEAYISETETILVRFPSGKEWYYSACPPAVWEAFTAFGQSRGKFIADELNAKTNGPWSG